MPATEQTWRNQTRMHAVFAVTGALMLLATVWMFAADHDREWKGYQIQSRNVDLKVNEMRQLQEATDANRQRQQDLQEQVLVQQSQPLDPELLNAFTEAIVDRARETGEGEPDLSHIDELKAKLNGDPQGDTPEERLGLAGVAGALREDETADPDEWRKAAQAAAETRQELVDELLARISRARFEEDRLLRDRKFRRADFDKARADLDIGVRDNLPAAEMQRRQSEVSAIDEHVAALSLQYEAASAHRTRIDNLLKKMTAEEDQAKKEAEENEGDLKSLQSAYEDQKAHYVEFYGIVPLPGKKMLELPILDAFNSPLQIDNLWSEGLEQDYNFRDVRRFDRCTTCHKSIDKSAPGFADKQAFVHEHPVLLRLPLTPAVDEGGESTEDASSSSAPPTLESFYGIQLANVGLIQRDAPTVAVVRPESIAAKAIVVRDGGPSGEMLGEEIRSELLQLHPLKSEDDAPGLMMGDVIVEINGDPVFTVSDVEEYLLAAAAEAQERPVDREAGPKTLLVQVSRGLPHPFASHPRLDLFVGSLSPHKISEFACTICHEGQGSATAFKWASHSPNDERQRNRWAQEYGWFDNHHWIYPMNPQRFAESSCLKCHHEVTELEPSEKYPQPPAPKLMRGYDLVHKYGCYGCHEVNGFDGPDKRVGPDMRLEPNYSAAALQLTSLQGFDQLSEEVQHWTHELAQHPELDRTRRRLYDALVADSIAPEPLLPAEAHGKIASLLRDVETPGSLRKAGPSLRYVAAKLDPTFLYDWLHNPQRFRPSTRMPRFFGLWNHLEAEPKALEKAQQLEPVEILGIETYLLHYSQNYQYAERPQGISPSSSEEMAARGKVEFQNRCLACHSHKSFPDAEAYREPNEIVQGPNLSAVAEKFAADRNPRGRDWLYSWIKNPSRYNARTLMPDLFLDPVTQKDKDGNVTAVTDPAADIVEFLLAESTSDWTPTEGAAVVAGGELHLDAEQGANVNAMAMEYLKDAFFEEAAARYLQYGVPAREKEGLKSAESELVVDDEDFDAQKPITDKQKLLYIGRKTVAKYGCYGCHDIAGFEDAKPIGTGLADWGRKESSKLAFEHIVHYLHGHGGGHAAAHGDAAHSGEDHGAGEAESADDAAYYLHQIQSGHRDGFIHQKLREPRSYDYHKAQNKKYNERLRMPQFPFTAAEREAVITFVLGLVADPPTEKYVYDPDPRQQAIVEGRQVLDKYNCGGCHLLETNQWKLAVQPGDFGQQLTPTLLNEIYPFLLTHHSPEVLEESIEQDRRGLVRTTIAGMPALENDGQPRLYDDDEGFPGDPVEPDEQYQTSRLHYAIDLWSPTVINGHPYEVGVSALNVSAQSIEDHYPARGGMLARYLLPHVVEREQQVNPAAKGAEAWGWLPPPLVGEGAKVQSDWLHDFLLEPHMIRPAVVLRMPKFNMSSDEAAKLARYFAAVDNVQYPYQFSSRRLASELARKEQQYEQRVDELGAAASSVPSNRFDAAVSIAVDKNYCRQCHIIADFEPTGSDRAKAPNLSQLYTRLRPEYVRDWIARPVSSLPYTNMPINIPYKADQDHLGGVSQQLYPGTSLDQLDGMVDWLMNYDRYAKERTLIAPLVGPDPPATDAQPAATTADAGAAGANP